MHVRHVDGAPHEPAIQLDRDAVAFLTLIVGIGIIAENAKIHEVRIVHLV